MVAELRARFLPGKKTMKPFGTEFCDHIAIASYSAGAWTAPSIEPLAPLSLHPAAHVLHYASSCFEGFKAYRWADGKSYEGPWKAGDCVITLLGCQGSDPHSNLKKDNSLK